MSEHDVTRKMLEIIRESEHSRKNIINESLKKRRLLKEVDENKEDKDLEPAELSEEEKKFRFNA